MKIEDILLDLDKLKIELENIKDFEVGTAINKLNEAIKWLKIVNKEENICSTSNNYDDIYKDCIG